MEVAERFEALDESGHVVLIEKRSEDLQENRSGGIEWLGSGPAYALLDGDPVERLDESLFRVISTGATLRRREGNHGVTHHRMHQSTGPSDAN